MKKKIYTCYTPFDDITFIMEDTINEKNELIATEVKGFYYGEPDEEGTEEFNGKLKAEFELAIPLD